MVSAVSQPSAQSLRLNMTKISVAICTWNRSRLLCQTLSRLTEIDTGADFSWELVIVNNNSSDDTDEIIAGFSDKLPIVSVFESQAGHSRCRNRAVENASGDYIIWTDNDVLVSQQWLVAYHQAFQSEPDAAFFGGPIEPLFEDPGRPIWLDETWEKCQAVYATRLLGDQPIELHERLLPYGANFAVKMDIQRDHLFASEFGRVGAQMVGDDETSVLREIASSGGKGRWVPDAGVQHVIPSDRASERYVRKYFVGQGQTNVRLGRHSRSPIIALCDAFWQSAQYRIKRRFAEPDEWVSHMIRASLSWGEFTERGCRAGRSTVAKS